MLFEVEVEEKPLSRERRQTRGELGSAVNARARRRVKRSDRAAGPRILSRRNRMWSAWLGRRSNSQRRLDLVEVKVVRWVVGGLPHYRRTSADRISHSKFAG